MQAYLFGNWYAFQKSVSVQQIDIHGKSEERVDQRLLLSLRSVCFPAHRNPHSADLQNGQLHLPLVGFLIRLAGPSRRLSNTRMHYPVRLPGRTRWWGHIFFRFESY